DFLRSPEWTLGIDDPVFVAQRCQISREGFWIGERHVLAEERQLSGTMSGSKLFQDKPSKQTRENLHGEKEGGPRSRRNRRRHSWHINGGNSFGHAGSSESWSMPSW